MTTSAEADTSSKGRTSVQRTDKQPAGARIRLLRKPEDFDDRDYLDEEEKAMGREIMDWFEQNYHAPVTNTMGMWLNDPKYAKTYHFEYHGIVCELCKELQEEPQKTGTYVVPHTVLNLLFLSVAKHFHWAWGMGAMAAILPDVKGFDPERIFMLDFPESEVWNEEQRFALIFAKAVLTLTVTDEIMAQAIEMWGVKLTIRHIALIGSLTSQALFMNAFNVAGRWNDVPGSGKTMSADPTREWDLTKTLGGVD